MKVQLKGFFIWIIFLSYLFTLFYLLYFSAYRNSVQGTLAYNVIPFDSIKMYVNHYDEFRLSRLTDNFFGNIAAFVPFGFLVPCVFPKFKLGRIIIGSFIFSFFIETIQILTLVGAFDVDDMILNTLGGIVGYLLLKVVKFLKFN